LENAENRKNKVSSFPLLVQGFPAAFFRPPATTLLG